MTARRTLLAVLAHPDDEVLCAGSLLAQRARGDRVVVLWLTHGEMTDAFGPLPTAQVANRRHDLGRRAAELLGVEHRFLDLGDTTVVASPETASSVARRVAELEPDGIVTWGNAWVKGLRHPDHQAAGKIARDAVTLARIAKKVAPIPPYRGFCPIFTIRGAHSALPRVTVNVEPWVPRILELADLYRKEVGFGDAEWLLERLSRAGEDAGLRHAEAFDAWETRPAVVGTLLPAHPGDTPSHPNAEAMVERPGGAISDC